MIFVVVMSVTCCLVLIGLAAAIWVVLRQRRLRRSMTSSRQPKCHSMGTAGTTTSGISMHGACTTPLITSFRLPPLPVSPPVGHESNYANEHSYEHQYDVLEYRAPLADIDDCIAGRYRLKVDDDDKETDLERMYVHRSDGYSPWPPRHVTQYATSGHHTGGSGLVYCDRR